jgi:hypothetical protein
MDVTTFQLTDRNSNTDNVEALPDFGAIIKEVRADIALAVRYIFAAAIALAVVLFIIIILLTVSAFK